MHTAPLMLNESIVNAFINAESGQECRVSVIRCLLENDLTHARVSYLVNMINTTL